MFCIEAECPKEELVEIILENDVLKIDGNYAIAWSAGCEYSCRMRNPERQGLKDLKRLEMA